MDSLEVLVAQVQALSGSTDDLLHLHGLLKQLDDSLQQQQQHHQAIQQCLLQLDPAKHSLGFLYFLDAFGSADISMDQSESFISTSATFINASSVDQVRMAPEKFTNVCKRMRDETIRVQRPIRAISPLHIAIRKLQPSSEYLTPLHADLLQICLLAKCYKAALSVLDDDIFEIDQKKTGLTPKDFLLFCYYGGMAYVGLKRFEKALELFQHAVTAPAFVLNAIVVESYKKYVLVSLIQNGQVPNLPKYTPSVTQRNVKSCAPDYVEFASVYSTRNIGDLKRSILAHEEVFQKDNNLGLAKQVVSSLYKRNIQRLTQTFLTLSLQDIAETVQLESPKDAELHILQMIQKGEIHAIINQKDGMVSFLEDPEQYKTRDIAQQLHGQIQKIIGLAKKIRFADEQVSCDLAYLSKIGRDRPNYDPEEFEVVPQKGFTNL
ncbi:hypothetical protein O6H91_10G017600 [Diphasiastrum complanatum]|uniref:Uncharacterized protein n=1 Tax=Diphasiastrum complanatum TaxID=34168 RepID=A0ACC2CF24_DIPCM|nr:hypothetical protein O6H91_10G017600 [Diphasiastrum complanatum]